MTATCMDACRTVNYNKWGKLHDASSGLEITKEFGKHVPGKKNVKPFPFMVPHNN